MSERYEEHWVFPKDVIHEIVKINRLKYGNRKDNQTGKQAEMDLDIKFENIPLTEKYKSYLNNYSLIQKEINS